MRVVLDSSVFIASFVEAHPKHKIALSWLKTAKKEGIECMIAAHSLLEIYSLLTCAPFEPPISPGVALKLIDANLKNISQTIVLSAREYLNLIRDAASSRLKGGIVYDALIVACARKAQADEILTLNAKDFHKLTEDDPIRVIGL